MSRRQRQNGDSNESWSGEGASVANGDGRYPRVVAVLPDLYEFPGEKVDERAFAKKRRAAFGRTSAVAIATFGLGVATSFAFVGFEPKTTGPVAEPVLAEAETTLDPFAEAGAAVDLPTFAASDSPMRSVPENDGFANGNDSFGYNGGASDFAATSVRPFEASTFPKYGAETDGNAGFNGATANDSNGFNGQNGAALAANASPANVASEPADEAFPTWADLENSTASNEPTAQNPAFDSFQSAPRDVAQYPGQTPVQNAVAADANAFPSTDSVAWNGGASNGIAASNVPNAVRNDFNNADYNVYNDNAAQNANVAANFNDGAAARAGANPYSDYNRNDGGNFVGFAQNNGSEVPANSVASTGAPNVPTTVSAAYPSANGFNGSNAPFDRNGVASVPNSATYVARVPDEYLGAGGAANPNSNVGFGENGNVGASDGGYADYGRTGGDGDANGASNVGGFNGYSTNGVADGSAPNGTNAAPVVPARSLRW